MAGLGYAEIKIAGKRMEKGKLDLPTCLCSVSKTHVLSNLLPVGLGGGIDTANQKL